jgi:GT2 family glycosyltransferase
MKYSIVIPTYNHCDDLLKPCIESIIRNTDMQEVEIIVVANGCTDCTRDYVLTLNNTKLIWFDEPIGYTRATNEGIKAATGDYVLLLNNDVQILDYWPKNQWLAKLTQPFLMNKKLAISGPVKYHEPAINKDFLIFFCVLINRSVFEKTGLLDEIFSPGYGEDIDFCMRVQHNEMEWECIINTQQENGIHVGNFPLYHKGTATFSEMGTYGEVVKRNKIILQERYT